MFSRFDTILACDRRTDGQTDVQPIAKTCFSLLLTHVKINEKQIMNKTKISIHKYLNK